MSCLSLERQPLAVLSAGNGLQTPKLELDLRNFAFLFGVRFAHRREELSMTS
jgi:hypothetical protein